MYQKLILQWVMYALALIRDERYDRKEVFRIFNEALAIAEDNVKNGEPLTTPDQLFVVEKVPGTPSSSSSKSPSSMSLSSKDSRKSFLALEFDEKTDVFNIQQDLCFKSLECLSTDVTTPSEKSTESVTLNSHLENVADELLEESNISLNINDSSEIILMDKSYSDELMVQFPRMRRISMRPCPPDRVRTSIEQIEEEVFKAWLQYQTWQLHMEQMFDYQKGYKDSTDQVTLTSKEQSLEFSEDYFSYWKSFLEKFEETIAENNQTIFINMCALMAIKELVLDYFYESFQFIMMKILFHTPHYHITQKINNTWSVPKRLKTEIKRPPKRKLPKPPKVKKVKEKKSKKGSKKSSKKSKKSKKSSKSSKSSKRSKKSDKKGKRGKLTKEEKERLAQLEREKELLEEEMRMKAENQVFMFPLIDAANDDFYQALFENWVRPVKEEKKGKKGKKDNKSKKKK